jgi:hypothetical protein
LENEKLEQDVLNPLGITANVYSLNMSKGQLIAHQATMSKQDRSLITINIYLKNGQGHYELSENPERDTPSECKFYEKFETLFQEAYAKDPRKSNDSPVPRVEAVLKRLKVEVRSAFNSMTHSRSLFFTPRTKRGALIGAQIGTLSGIALGIYLSLSDTITFAMIGLNSLPPYAAIILLTVIMTAIVSALFAITYKLNEPEDNAQCRC